MGKRQMDEVKELVAGRLRAQAPGPHPDPELMTSFAERSLPQGDQRRILAHLAACPDCREIVYLATPELTEAQPVLAVPRSQPRLAIRWGALAASVVIIGGVLISNRGLFYRHSGESPVPTSNSPQPARDVTDRLGGPNPNIAEGQAAPRARAPLKHMTAKPKAEMKFDKSGQVYFANSGSVVESESGANSKMVVPATPAWRLSPAGQVMRSLDGGKNWKTISVTDGGPFRVINAIGFTVWVGGNAGALYKSGNEGLNWNKVEPVFAGRKLQADITEISFTDAANGSIRTANGEFWATSDGGKNWQLK